MSLSPFFPGAPPLGIYVQPGLLGSHGRRARPGRPLVGQCGRGGGSLCPGLLPRLPRAATKAGGFACAFLGAAVPLRPTAPAQSRRLAAGNAGVSARCGGPWRAAALSAAVASPPLGAAALSEGCGAAVAPASLRPPTGRGGGGGGER